MLTLIVEAILGALKAILGLGASKDPSAVHLASTAATAQSGLQQEQVANDILQKASVARADAGAGVVRDLAGANPTGALKRDFPDDFRD